MLSTSTTCRNSSANDNRARAASVTDVPRIIRTFKTIREHNNIMAELQHKIQRAIKLLQAIPTTDGPVEVCYSGGKDSDVILQLAKLAGINYRAIYKNTTIDPPGTIAHAKAMGAEIMRPEISFLELVKKKGFPSRFGRFCCSELKEYPILPRAIVGIRRGESRKRAERYHEPETCRIYKNIKGQPHIRQYFPILDWTNDDVAQFVAQQGISCHPLYYDDSGSFLPERRLGCIGCPLASQKKRRAQFLQYPKLLEAQKKALQSHWDNRIPPSKTQIICNNNAWNFMFYSLFCDSILNYQERTHTLFDFNPEQFIKDYFNII